MNRPHKKTTSIWDKSQNLRVFSDKDLFITKSYTTIEQAENDRMKQIEAAAKNGDAFGTVIKLSTNESESVFEVINSRESSRNFRCSLKWPSKKEFTWEGLPDFLIEDLKKFRRIDMRTCPEYCLNLTVRKASNDLELF